MAFDFLEITQDDFDGTPQTDGLRVKAVSEHASYTAFDTATGALATQLDAWTNGRAHAQNYNIKVVDNGPGKATLPAAQKSTQLIMEIKDVVTGTIYRERVAMPDLLKAADGSNPAWIAQGQGNKSLTVANPVHAGYISLKAAYDAIGRSKNGNAATLERMYVEG